MTRPFALIIGDDPVLGGIFNETLKHAGFDAALDIGGIEYVSILVTRRPSMVVLDLNLPEDLGSQVLEDLRNLHPEYSLPVVLVTGDRFQARDLKSKGETVLVKPIIPEHLMELVLRVKETLVGKVQ